MSNATLETPKNTIPSDQAEILDIFKQTGALLEGHFVLRSGLHSAHYFQCARVCEQMEAVSRLTTLLIKKLGSLQFDTVLAPAMGGLVIGQEVARQAKARYLFAEKVDDRLALRRGFELKPDEQVLVVEDVITRGGRAKEALDIVKQRGANPVGVAILVDRSEGKTSLGTPITSLLELSFPTYAPDALPEGLAALPAIKPGS